MRGSAAFRVAVAPGGALAGPWVQNSLWTAARAVPSLDLRFAENKSLVDATTGAQLVTFTRASSGTFVGSDGVLQTAATDAPRFDHNPTTGESLGLLAEEARTNLLLNSATLSTQMVTVAAAANTLSFYGTGTVTLTGVSTAGPLVGTGANNRVSLTFTPTVGVLILTVSGSVTNAQLEAGAFPTSYIPTTTTAVTRAADVASITGSAFSSWYRQDEGTVFVDYKEGGGTGQNVLSFSDGSSDNLLLIRRISGFVLRTTIRAAAALVVDLSHSNSIIIGQPLKRAIGYKSGDYASTLNGGASVTSSAAGIPSGTNQLNIGSSLSNDNQINGHISRLTYWPTRLPNSTLQAVTQ